jgi:hypothetical protein
VSENSCSSAPAPRCSFYLPLKAEFLELRWTKNPDPSRVGKRVETVIRTNKFDTRGKIIPGEEVVSKNPTFGLDRITNHLTKYESPVQAAGMADLRIECDSMNWMPEIGKGGGFSSWQMQQMTNNQETGVNENYLVTLATGLHFVRLNPNVVELGKINRVLNQSSGETNDLGLVASESLFVTSLDKSGDACTATLGVDVKPLIAFFEKLQESRTKDWTASNSDDYRAESDELLKSGQSTIRYSIFQGSLQFDSAGFPTVFVITGERELE